MILSFADQETRDIFDENRSKKALQRLPVYLWPVAQRKLHMIKAAIRLEDLKVPPGNRLEPLSGNLKGQHSIRINDQYRLVFKWLDPHAEGVYICDYHS